VDPDIAYAITKAVYDHAEDVRKISIELQDIRLDFATKYLMEGIPVHAGAARYFRNLGTSTNEDYSMARVDFNLSEKDSLYYRWVYDPSELVADAVIDPFLSRSTILSLRLAYDSLFLSIANCHSR